jgi:hypothetical protein
MTGDVPLLRALRMVEDLIRERMAGLHRQAQNTQEPRARRQIHTRADELGLLIREIQKARGERDD